jgi:DNA-binding SARP family transcriptional activator
LTALNPLFRAKIRVPLLPEPHVSRPRVVSALRTSLRRRVTLLVSPAGSGKTTALSELARSLDAPASWYTIDELDRDDLAVLHGLALAVGAVPTSSRDRQAHLAQVINALDQGATPSRLILDDVHRLTDSRAQQALCDLIRYLPRNARLILAGRVIPERFSDLLGWCDLQKQLEVLTWQELQLSDDERKRAAEVLGIASRGAWILNWTRPEGFNLTRYLREEVIGPLDATAIRHLGRLSVLPSFDAALAACVMEVTVTEAARWLAWAYERLPLFERTSANDYRFGEQARDVLIRTLGPDFREARRAAAGALLPVDPARSAEILLDVGDSGAAADALALLPLNDWLTQSPRAPHQLLERLAGALVQRHSRLTLAQAWAAITWQGRPSAVQDLLGPGPALASDPEETFWRSYLLARAAFARGDQASARAAYEDMSQATRQLRAGAGSDPALIARLLCRRAIVERSLGLGAQSIETAQQGLAITGLEPATTKAEQLLLHHTMGNVNYLDGDYKAADQSLACAAALAESLGDVAEEAAIAHLQAGIARAEGELTRALETLERALRNSLLPNREKTMLLVQSGHALADIEDFRGASQRYRSVMGMLRESDRDGFYPRALAGYATACSVLGLMDEADAALVQLRELPDGVGCYDRLVAEGVRRLRDGEPGDAENCFKQARATSGSIGGFRDEWQSTLLQAQAQLLAGNHGEATATIREFVMSVNVERPLPAAAFWVVRPVEKLLATLEQDGAFPRLTVFLRKTGRRDPSAPRLRHASQAIAASDAARPRDVEVQLFGPGRIVVDGTVFTWPYGLRRKAIELFWYSLLHSDGFTRDQAVADLCPDLDATRGQRLVQVATADLRGALGKVLGVSGDQVLARDSDGRLRLRLDQPAGTSVRVDIELVRELVDGIRRRQRDIPKTVPEYFRGEFLAGFDAEWIEPIRRYWTSTYLRTLSALANRYAQLGELQQAIRCHELSLAVDPTHEASHRALMRLYHTAGDRPALDAQMWLYARATREELDADVNPQIQALFEKLTEQTLV